MVDVRFCDLPGIMQHFTVPVSSFDESVFEDGLNFDGSSIRGFQAINESDMSLFPDPTTAYIDPFRKAKTLNVNFFIHDPITGEPYSRDPRNIARKALAYLVDHRHRRHGVLRPRGGVLHLRQRALLHQGQRRLLPDRLGRRAGGTPATRASDNLGYKARFKGGYFPVEPYDHYSDLRAEMVKNLEKPACRSSAPTTRSAPPARRRSTTASTRCSRPPTT